jgi:hypothetical protein
MDEMLQISSIEELIDGNQSKLEQNNSVALISVSVIIVGIVLFAYIRVNNKIKNVNINKLEEYENINTK